MKRLVSFLHSGSIVSVVWKCVVCVVCVCVVCVWVWVVMGGGVRAAGRPRAYRKVSTEL